MQRFLDSVGRSDGSVYVGLFRSWREIAGARIADHTQPVDVKGHALVVESDHPAWTQMVMFSRARILRELQRRFPDLHLTGMIVRLTQPGQQPEPKTPEPRQPLDDTPQTPPAPPSADTEEALDRIPDDDLRETLRRLREQID